jgi:hypothetical protein
MSRKHLSIAAAFVGFGCAATTAETAIDEEQLAAVRTRSWKAHPAIVEIDEADEIYAVSDPHGEYEIFSKLLAANHLADAFDADPTKVTWTGGAAILVVAGDMIDKGPESLQVLDLVRTLQADAPKSGGRVIATIGNHEAEFMLDPHNQKATSTGEDAIGIDNQLKDAHIDPKWIARGVDPSGRGRWILDLPFGVRIKKWFFSHAGNTQRLSVGDLEEKLESSLDHNGFGDHDITGKNSILEAQGWYGDPNDHGAGRDEADALGVRHIVFGHDPGAFGEHGSVRASANGVLFKIDTAMGIHDEGAIGRAFLLHIKTVGNDTAEVLDDNGRAEQLL